MFCMPNCDPGRFAEHRQMRSESTGTKSAQSDNAMAAMIRETETRWRTSLERRVWILDTVSTYLSFFSFWRLTLAKGCRNVTDAVPVCTRWYRRITLVKRSVNHGYMRGVMYNGYHHKNETKSSWQSELPLAGYCEDLHGSDSLRFLHPFLAFRLSI